MNTLKKWIKKRQELVIVAGFVLLIGLLIYLSLNMKQNYFRGGDKGDKEKMRERVNLTTQSAESGDVDSEGNQKSGLPITTYFLKPSPAEVMSMVKEIVGSELPVPEEKYNNLRIVWPAYFFKILEQDSVKATVLFDTSKDGFGVNISTEINILDNPDILAALPYQKVWLAGEISAIDPDGTGTIYMTTEHVRFREELEEVKRAESKSTK
ncbi:hypothetical protein [Desulfopila sp. IMCC35008]|uniref:hypothetical protein n=1 Tax=Desulfopila sp. IMCC35008 TaxID=2653858 RepID=UPI0013D27B74|nr:hypothetical protein [Desulfopila sp. IMCC35008]